ncbi:MAG: hypothetical protein R3B47_07785 [Bacteroidia bacterium]
MARLEKGGEIIIPGAADEVVQYIDVRDLAEWMIRLAETRLQVPTTASGPGFAMTTNAFCAWHPRASPAGHTQIDDLEFLQKHELIGIQPWVCQLPQYAGMSKSDNSKAIGAGLTFRPLAETVGATHAWWYSDAVTQERRDNILTGERSPMRREAEILAAWRARDK